MDILPQLTRRLSNECRYLQHESTVDTWTVGKGPIAKTTYGEVCVCELPRCSKIQRDRKSVHGFHGSGEEGELLMAANENGDEISLRGDENFLKLDSRNANSVNTLQTTNLYTLEECLWFVNYISTSRSAHESMCQ